MEEEIVQKFASEQEEQAAKIRQLLLDDDFGEGGGGGAGPGSTKGNRATKRIAKDLETFKNSTFPVKMSELEDKMAEEVK